MSPRPTRPYGHIPGYPVGARFADRAELSDSGVHTPPQQGIWGGADGTCSIVVSGGYVDDVDEGDVIVYTGQGGNDPASKRQVADQELDRGNAGLARCQLDGLPVRVIRGSRGDPRYSPAHGLRYDGLFAVVDHWHESGRDGFRIWRFRLERLEAEAEAQDGDPGLANDVPPARTMRLLSQISRNPGLALEVKRLHDFTCQVCATRLATPAGPYAEAAHIRALGTPHDGPDVLENMLCLCPNDHVLFDTGGITIADDFSIVSADGQVLARLRRRPAHPVVLAHIQYHRRIHGG